MTLRFVHWKCQARVLVTLEWVELSYEAHFGFYALVLLNIEVGKIEMNVLENLVKLRLQEGGSAHTKGLERAYERLWARTNSILIVSLYASQFVVETDWGIPAAVGLARLREATTRHG